MGWADYKRDLQSPSYDVDEILHRYFHTGQSAVFQGADPIEEPRFKRTVADQIAEKIGIKCHPLQLVICGSAHLGFSPVPEKFVTMFNSESSDIDVAVVSAELFDCWWTELQECNSLTPMEQDRIAADLFWGFIDPSKVHHLSTTGKSWWKLFGDFRIHRARAVRGRVYRTYWNMQNYHKHAIRRGHEKLRLQGSSQKF